MTTYGYMQISSSWTSKGIGVRSTDSETLDWIIAEVPKLINISHAKVAKETVYGELTQYHINNLSSSDMQIEWWIIKQMCLRGWEPFALYYHDGISLIALRCQLKEQEQ